MLKVTRVSLDLIHGGSGWVDPALKLLRESLVPFRSKLLLLSLLKTVAEFARARAEYQVSEALLILLPSRQHIQNPATMGNAI